jgi:hypothetical protein
MFIIEPVVVCIIQLFGANEEDVFKTIMGLV